MANTGLQSIADVQSHARSWLFEAAAPLWSSAGVLTDGMFAERVSLYGEAQTQLNRRLRVQARQIYAFCVIGELGWDGPWKSVVEKAVSILVKRGITDEGFFVHLFDAEGTVINRSLDLYDHAFGLLALAHAARALNKPEYLDIAANIRDRMMAAWWRKEGGFWEGELTACPPYRQNPHMHMYESALIHYKITGSKAWGDLAERLYTLFMGRFYDPESGAMTEYFDQEWKRLDGEQGDIVEPGHCFEWAWLLDVGATDNHGATASEALSGFARRHGIDASKGVAINEVLTDGRIRDGAARLWPQTERLKAAITRHIRQATAETETEIVSAYKGLSLYFDAPVNGVWRDRFNVDGSWVEEAAPASSFYHIVCALEQLLSLN